MKKLLVLIAVCTLSSAAIAQNDRMMNNNGNSSWMNSNGNSSFSLTEVLLFAILIILIVAGLVWFFNSYRKVK